MLHTGDLLIDDRAGVEFGGDVMATRADEFYSTLMGLAVGMRAGKGGKERMMDVDHAPNPPLAQLGRDDLHEAGQHGHLSAPLVELAFDGRESGGALTRLEWHMDEGKPFALRRGFEIAVVTDDSHEVHIEVARTPPPKEVGEAVAFAADQNGGTWPGSSFAQGPLGIQPCAE